MTLVEVTLSSLLRIVTESHRHRVIASLGLASALTDSQLIKEVMLALNCPRPPSLALDRTIDVHEYWDLRSGYLGGVAMSRSRGPDPDRARDRDVSRVLARSLAMILALWKWIPTKQQHELAIVLAELASSRSPATPRVSKDDDIICTIADAEWLCYSPGASDIKFDGTADGLEGMVDVPDDWTRLLALHALLSLGVGSPDLCAARNELLAKGIKDSTHFTFPEELHPETATPLFCKEFPALLRLAFLHDPDYPWLIPEKFDAQNPDARFFLAKPREFFALAAELLDPDGKTDLVKWRKTS